KGSNNFVLRVKGESMINAGILDEDYVVVDKKNTALNSQIVVALINGESATVKRFFKEGNLIRLQPENDFMEPIMLNDSEVEIVTALY
ncbi:LexA family protein, partial [Clostridioides difficile]|uniref:LexA family protein n=1 Tax=Clostridioides difficile TaxID=1496 RepID=UPI0023501F24